MIDEAKALRGANLDVKKANEELVKLRSDNAELQVCI